MWTQPRSYIVNEVLTASIFNTDHRDNLLSLEHVIDVTTADGAELTNTTTDTQIYAVTIPANAMGANGVVRLTLIGSAKGHVSGAALLTARVKWGGSYRLAHPVQWSTITTYGLHWLDVWIANQGATNSQQLWGNQRGYGFNRMDPYSGAEPVTTSVDTTSAQSLEIWWQWDGAQTGNSAFRRWARTTVAQN